MKAVIMAGGEGTRLRPLSLGSPKPMTPLLGRPVMEHILALLKRHGIEDICVTLCYRPEAILEAFGSGEQYGVALTYFIEEDPLGTAGSVRRCLDHLGPEPFLVISGDCVCDLDLGALERFHQEREAEVTLGLYAHPDPVEYGLVVTDDQGRIQRFVEKPGWGQVVTNRINTGIYILSPSAFDQLPDGHPSDFGRDLFPALLAEGRPLYGCTLEGYWCDMGDSKAYLSCVADALTGKVKLELGLPERAPGIWSGEDLPEGVNLVPPAWLDREVRIGAGAVIGPCTVLHRGSQVGEKATLQHTVLLEDAGAGERVTAYGAIFCRGACARKGAVLNEGAVLGENALAEEGSVLLERVKLWPGQTAPSGCRLARSITRGSQKAVLRFGSAGTIQGVLGEDIGPEALLALGSALGKEGRVGVGCSHSPGAELLCRAAEAGIMAAGGTVVRNHLEAPVQGAWAAHRLGLNTSLYIEEESGLIYLHFFDLLGLPLGRVRERKLEHEILQGEARHVRGVFLKEIESPTLPESVWAREIADQARLHGAPFRRVTVAVGEDSPADRAVRAVLAVLNCHLEETWRPGIIGFSASHGGFRLTARDERGTLLDAGQVLTLSALIEMENGEGKLAVASDASAAVDLVATGYGGHVLRLDRDGEEARRLYSSLPWLWAAPSAAARICERMRVSGQKLETLISKTPRFSAWRREVPLTADRGQIMQALAKESGTSPQGEGLRLRSGGGYVAITPLTRQSALRVLAEGPDLEAAAELCDFYSRRAQELDRAVSEQSGQDPYAK